MLCHCSALTSLYLSKESEIGLGIYECGELTDIKVEKGHPLTISHENENALVSRVHHKLLGLGVNSFILEGVEILASVPSAYRLETLKRLASLPSVESLEATMNAKAIKRFEVDEDNPYFYTDKDGLALLSKRDREVIALTSEFKIPEGAKVLSRVAVAEGIHLAIPASLTYIRVSSLLGSQIASISVDPANPVYRSNAEGTQLIHKATDYVLYEVKKDGGEKKAEASPLSFHVRQLKPRKYLEAKPKTSLFSDSDDCPF